MSIKQAEKSTRGTAFFGLLSERMVGLQIRSSVFRGKWIPGVHKEMQNLLARQHFNTLTLPLVSTVSRHQTPQELAAGTHVPLPLCVCVQTAFTARTKRKEHSSSQPPYLTLTHFVRAAVAEAEPVQRKGWKSIRKSFTTSSSFHSGAAPVDHPESSDTT